MERIKRRIEIVLTAVFIIAAGLFCYLNFGSKTVTAKADTAVGADEFYMDGTMYLSVPRSETDSIESRFPYHIGSNVVNSVKTVECNYSGLYNKDSATKGFYAWAYDNFEKSGNPKWAEYAIVYDVKVKVVSNIFLFRSETMPTADFFSSKYFYAEDFNKKYDYCIGWNNNYGFPITDSVVWSGSIPDYSKEYYYVAAVVYTYYSEMPGVSVENGLRGYYVDKVCSNYTKKSYKYVAEKILENNVDQLNELQVRYYQRIAGITISTSDFEVVVNYRELEKVNAKKLSKASKVFRVDSMRVLDKEYVFWNVMQLMGKKYISDFNVIQRELSQSESGSSSGKDSFLIDERTWLQAKDYTYTFNSATNKGTLDINYEKFTASNFPLVVTNNKEDNNLTAFLFSTNIKIAGGVTTITYDTTNLETRLCNNYGWEFPGSDFNNFLIENPYSTTGEVSIVKNYTADDKGENHVTSLTVTTSDENLLADCDVRLEVSIIPPVECDITVKYEGVELVDGILTDKAYEAHLENKVWSNKLKSLTYNEFLNGNESKNFPACADLINGVLNIDELNLGYITPYDKQVKVNMESSQAIITVLYKYRPVFYVSDNMSSESYYLPVYNDKSLEYSGAEFLKEYEGYRAKDISCDNKAVAEIRRNFERPDNMKKATVRVNCAINEKIIIPLYVTYTNEYEVKIGHLENIRARGSKGNGTLSGLAQRVVTEKTITVDFFKDIYSPTEDELKKFFDLTDLRVIGQFGMPDLEKTSVKFEDDIYEIELTYGYAAVKVQESDGNYVELKVPMSRYSEWTKTFGEDWSVLALNTTEKVIFTDTVTIKREEVYGYFFVSAFEEKVTDLNDLFANFSSGGCKTFFQLSEVKGSGFYKFMRDTPWLLPTIGAVVGMLSGHPVKGAAIGAGVYYGVMAIDEFANEEDRTYYSYFSYLDGTSELPFTSRSGAMDAGDNDSAIKNTLQDLLKDFKDWIGNSELSNVVKKVLSILAIVIIAVLILRVAFWAVGSINRSVRKIKNESEKSTRKKKK